MLLVQMVVLVEVLDKIVEVLIQEDLETLQVHLQVKEIMVLLMVQVGVEEVEQVEQVQSIPVMVVMEQHLQ
jgi:hypothetical protein